MSRRIARSFGFDFSGSPEAVWTAMADTARYNEAAGLPRHKIEEAPQPDGSVAFIARAKIGPFELEWEDLPCNWVRGRWFEHRRRFRRGPLTALDARFELQPAAGGCHGDYRMEVAFRGIAGAVLRLGGFVASGEHMFQRLAAEADRFARGEQPMPFAARAPILPEGARERLDRLARSLEGSGYAHGLAQHLATHVAEASEADVRRMRPLELARHWGVPGLDAIEACLQATRQGLLELRWDLLCPRCRGAKAGAASLDRLPSGAHCGTCNIAYDRDFSRNVELSFRPAAAIRPLEEGEFCLLGPMSTPHIWAHVTLEAGEEREVALDLPPGPYRLRTLEAGPQTDIEHTGGGGLAVTVTAEGLRAEPGAAGGLALGNRSPWRRTLVVEERRWVQDALTADRVATLQAFRDLFSDEVLRPGDEVAIRRVTLLFSDLKGSTALYDAIGDAAAYHRVREHFAFLAGIVREHEGAIVKTIGDAVMAAFHDPLKGLAAALAMQDRIAAFNAASAAPIVLKLGLHEGPCIAVTLNERLDYFGSTVNLAARLQNQSLGDDIVVSVDLARTHGAEALLQRRQITRETVLLRGISTPVTFLRLR